MRFWGALAAYLVFDVAATWATASWLKVDDRRFLIGAFLGYVGCTAAWLWGVARADSPGLTRALAIYPVMALMIGVLAGLAFTGEKLTGRAWVGVALGLASVILLATEDAHR